MDFFPEPPIPPEREEPAEQHEPVWAAPPQDVVPGVVPVELILGRSETAVVMLTGMRAFATGLHMNLGVRVRGPVVSDDLHAEVFDGPYSHDRTAKWRASRLKWGFELADGRRVTNVDPWPAPPAHDGWMPHPAHVSELPPDHPVLQGGGGSAGRRSADRDYWLWPLPPAGRLRVVCQWLDQGIEMTAQDLDAQPFLDAASRAQPAWPSS